MPHPARHRHGVLSGGLVDVTVVDVDSMRVDVPPHVVATTVTLGAPAPDPFETVVLRTFDELQRAMAQHLAGVDGMFIGYDELEIGDDSFDVPALVRATALLVEDRGGRHAIEYRATLAGAEARTVARASGWTLVPSERELATGIVPTSPVRLSEEPW